LIRGYLSALNAIEQVLEQRRGQILAADFRHGVRSRRSPGSIVP
jgi:hypothetical protein